MKRRDFLTTTAATVAGIGTLGPAFLFGRSRYLQQFADMKKRVGLIGSGWYGKADLLRLVQVAPVQVVSLCDVDSAMVSEAADLVATRQASKQRPRTYKDYREMLREKDLDIVLIGTPDHWHALPMIEAVKAGADIYVQKPISIDVTEGQAMLAAARRTSVSCRSARSGAARRTWPRRATASSARAGWAPSPTSRSTATTTCARGRIPPTSRRRPRSTGSSIRARRRHARSTS